MDNNRKSPAKPDALLKTGVAVSCVLAVIIAVGYFLAMRTGFDFRIGHFDSTPWFYIFSCGIIVSFVFSLVLALRVSGCSVTAHEVPSPVEIISRVIAAAAGVAPAAIFFYEMIKYDRELTTLDKLAGIMSVLIPLAFFVTAFWSERKLAAILNILAALAFNFTVFAAYFDFSIPVNSPVRNVMTVVRCALLLFFVSESRLMLPAESKRFTVKFAVFTYFFSFTVPFGVSVGALIERLTVNDPADPSPSVAWLILFIAISLVSLNRMAGLCKVIAPKTSTEEIIETEGE